MGEEAGGNYLLSPTYVDVRGRHQLNHIRGKLLVAGPVYPGDFYAWGAVSEAPSAPSYSGLLREARRAAVLVQQGRNKEWNEERFQYKWHRKGDLLKARRYHMTRAAATPEQQRIATTRGVGMVGCGLSATAMAASEPATFFKVRRLTPVKIARRRPVFPISKWQVVHKERCLACATGATELRPVQASTNGTARWVANSDGVQACTLQAGQLQVSVRVCRSCRRIYRRPSPKGCNVPRPEQAGYRKSTRRGLSRLRCDSQQAEGYA